MSFSVRILGSGSAIPTGRRNPSAQYIDCCNRYILLDCAEGTQLQIRKHGLKIQKIGHILISHLHGDHYFGLVGLLSTMSLLGRTQSICIYGPTELKEIIELQFRAGKSELSFSLEFKVPAAEKDCLFEDEKIRIDSFPLFHKITTFGYRITQKEGERKLLNEKVSQDRVPMELWHRLKLGESPELDGKKYDYSTYTTPGDPLLSYAYCSDTVFHPAVVEAVKGVDLLYHEATFIEDLRARAEQTRHSTALDAAKVARDAGVKKLLMGHISARYDSGELHQEEARSYFPDAVVVEDGDAFQIK